jgi:hypothetical protein
MRREGFGGWWLGAPSGLLGVSDLGILGDDPWAFGTGWFGLVVVGCLLDFLVTWWLTALAIGVYGEQAALANRSR